MAFGCAVNCSAGCVVSSRMKTILSMVCRWINVNEWVLCSPRSSKIASSHSNQNINAISRKKAFEGWLQRFELYKPFSVIKNVYFFTRQQKARYTNYPQPGTSLYGHNSFCKPTSTLQQFNWKYMQKPGINFIRAMPAAIFVL
jgi:hypothetical protein